MQFFKFEDFIVLQIPIICAAQLVSKYLQGQTSSDLIESVFVYYVSESAQQIAKARHEEAFSGLPTSIIE